MRKQPSELGKYIKKYRQQHGLRQKDVAELSKKDTNYAFSQSLIWSIESGYRQQIRNLEMLKSLSKILGLTINKVYKLNGFPKHPTTKSSKRGHIIGKELRKTGLSTQQIANRLNVSITTVDSWLRGSLPSFETDILLIARLHINVGSFNSSAAHKIHELFNVSGTKKFKLLRLLHGWSLNNVYNFTNLNRTRSLIDVEAGRSYNFNIIYHLANLYHIHVRAITKHKFSLYHIDKVSNTVGTKLLILRHLKEFTLSQLSNSLHNEFSISDLDKIEHDFKPVNIQLIGGLSRIYGILFKVMLNFLGYRINGISPNKREVQNGIKLKEIRVQNKFTLSRVSKLTNHHVNRSVLSSCENGNKAINVNVLPYLADIYHIQLKNLLSKLELKVQLDNKGINIPVLSHYKV